MSDVRAWKNPCQCYATLASKTYENKTPYDRCAPTHIWVGKPVVKWNNNGIALLDDKSWSWEGSIGQDSTFW